MKICILGGDGYLGWPTTLFMSSRGHDVMIIDNCVKRQWEAQCGVTPLVPLPLLSERVRLWNERTNALVKVLSCDVSADYEMLKSALQDYSPDVIVHFAEQPSAPFSMDGQASAVETQRNNVIGTLNLLFATRHACPNAHLVKLGTMGEYGTPNIDIEEGWLDVTHAGRTDRMLFPKRPGSIYHLSKVHDSANLEFACRTWGMRVTDLNQGVVYGTDTDETLMAEGLHTSFHYDGIFGTVLNRFVAQAVAGIPMTIYGKGTQVRGFINIRDTIRCVEIASSIPPERGEFRVFNQVTSHNSINELAFLVQAAAKNLGIETTVRQLQNPRMEAELHYYNPKYTALQRLGLIPHDLTVDIVGDMLRSVMSHKHRIKIDQIATEIAWS